MKNYRYSKSSLFWEIAISVVILGAILAFLIGGTPPLGTTIFLIVIGVPITYYLGLSLNKWQTKVNMDDKTISLNSPASNLTLKWGKDLKVRVRYYGSRKKSGGVHNTRISSSSGTLKFDSALEDFFVLMADIGGKILKYEIEIDEISQWNLEKMSAIPPQPKTSLDEVDEPPSDSPKPPER